MMTKSEQINELAAALAKAQGEMTAPPKDKTAKVPTKSGGSYSYSYADIATVIESVKSALSKNGLSVSHQMVCEPGFFGLQTMLMHSSGQYVSSVMPLPQERGPQELGSYLTYYRRYALCAIVGIAADEDDDANNESGNEAEIRPTKPPVATAPSLTTHSGGDRPSCENCGSQLILNNQGTGYYCPNYKDKSRGFHSSKPVAARTA